MCGIVGYIGNKDAKDILINGLEKLEYRGYDSAGVAFINGDKINKRRNAGKIQKLKQVIEENPIEGKIGLGHTRWATHGRPTEENAHPHSDCDDETVIVQNGIIENYMTLKEELKNEGHTFRTETDTEIVAHLIEKYQNGGADLMEALRLSAGDLEGNYAVAVLSSSSTDKIAAHRSGPPLIIGIGEEEENYVASDIQAILEHTKDMIFLKEGDFAEIKKDSITITDSEGKLRDRPSERISWDPVMAEKDGYKHFMLKEINEQPRAVRETIVNRIGMESGDIHLKEIDIDIEVLKDTEKIVLVACGTAWHACLVGKRYIEALAGIPCEVDYGSEYRYRNPIVGDNTLAVPVSQSGETADTLAAVEEASGKGARVLSICNVIGSILTRKSDGVIYTHAGPEIGVASTKAFTSQLSALFILALFLGQIKNVLDREERIQHCQTLMKLPHQMDSLLEKEEKIEDIAFDYRNYEDFLYLGRKMNYPLALEGALKLKEISYIHAEGYPGGEMKHGPIALIEEDMPTVAIALQDSVYSKMTGNIEEVKARGGKVLAVITEGDTKIKEMADETIEVPEVPEILSPVLVSIPLQLLAYHIGTALGCDVDQPRNLAKSVTVE